MKGVTLSANIKKRFIRISIHTPMKGVTWAHRCIHLSLQISIHTPMKGVTCALYRFRHFATDFNPHSHEGSDHCTSTPFSLVAVDFNPHSHEGSDLMRARMDFALSAISIHTPMKGVTFQSTLPWREWLYDGADRGRYIGISIHTPMKGVTAILSNLGLLFFNFFHQFPN